MPEPGRGIVIEESCGDGRALPWVSLEAFAHRAIEQARRDRQSARDLGGWVFFDRGLIDAAVALEWAAEVPIADTLIGADTYHAVVFLTPPWPEIYVQEAERQHGFADALEEYDRLYAAYSALGYEVIILPKTDVTARADFVLKRLG
ncbi:putative ATPase [Phaeobacter porticola]|uniref:Putative ATPase n=1 Tax=Phaeobacter porticola TaxID=1844006 RepID=A0A1L3I8E0_9RHOB|nr:putative ATPase [Phaeobacter porticola]